MKVAHHEAKRPLKLLTFCTENFKLYEMILENDASLFKHKFRIGQ